METGFLSAVFGVLQKELFFALCGAAVFSGFLVCLFITVFKKEYGVGKRTWYFLVVALTCALLKARSNTFGEADYSPILLFFGVLLFFPIYFIPEKKKEEKTETDSRRELIRFIDKNIKAGGVNAPTPAPTEKETEVLKAKPRTEEISDGLDFSHVKNVLQRLEPATLSFSDRKQIHDLELALYEAERGDVVEETKTKINEGLGNLLKIMAKHGV